MLVVVGELDAITPPAVARQMAALAPEAELVELPGVGHLTPGGGPGRVCRCADRVAGPPVLTAVPGSELLVGAVWQGGHMGNPMTNSDESPPSATALPSYPGASDLVQRSTGQALALRGLTKSFGGRPAVDHIDLDVPVGSFFGLVGPNGAGKTTTLSMVTGLMRPDAGRVIVAGVDVWADPTAAKARMGVLPDGLRLFERLSGPELLSYLGRLRGMPAATVNDRAGELIKVLDLDEAGNKLVADYSTGMRKKITLAAALLHSPAVLLLDEPLEAVDPVSARIIRGVLDRYTKAGGTVVFSSHVMALVEGLCSHVAVMAHGRIIAAGELAEVRGSAASLDDAFMHLVGAPASRGRGAVVVGVFASLKWRLVTSRLRAASGAGKVGMLIVLVVC